MLHEKTFLAVIPARGGSKRLPRKNILPLGDKPLIAWSIEAAKGSKYIDKCVVSSDDSEILTIAKEYGATLLERPAKLASDQATTFEALEHALEHYREYDYIVLLQPTSPLRTSKHIDESIELLEKKGADAIISVCEMEHSPLWSNTLPDNGSMENFLKEEVLNKRSQDLEQYYRLNGAIYICKVESFLKERSFFLKKSIFAYIMSKEDSIDIDEKIDFELAKVYLNMK